MPKVKEGIFYIKRSFDKLKRDRIQSIKIIVKDNPGIKSNILIAKISVNPPFIERKKALDLIESLHLDGQISINDDDEVNLCQ